MIDRVIARAWEETWLYSKIEYLDQSEACADLTIILKMPRYLKIQPLAKPIAVTMLPPTVFIAAKKVTRTSDDN
jgi:hypothetical protein